MDNELHRGYYTSCTESFGSRLISVRGRIFSVDNELHRGYYTSCTESFGSRLISVRGRIFSVDNELHRGYYMSVVIFGSRAPSAVQRALAVG